MVASKNVGNGRRAIFDGASPQRQARAPGCADHGGTIARAACSRLFFPQKERRTMADTPSSIYDFEALTIDGKKAPLAAQRGKVMLIVNTASACGFTPQFEGLEALWKAHRDEGLVVIGFPSNEFGSQDPGSDSEIASFCQLNYGVSFPMMGKVEVNGAGAHPLWQWLTKEAPGLLGSKAVKWNFTKFLVGRDGRVIKRYAPTDTPASIERDIAGALAA
jgi:glutathione peroxidase